MESVELQKEINELRLSLLLKKGTIPTEQVNKVAKLLKYANKTINAQRCIKLLSRAERTIGQSKWKPSKRIKLLAALNKAGVTVIPTYSLSYCDCCGTAVRDWKYYFYAHDRIQTKLCMWHVTALINYLLTTFDCGITLEECENNLPSEPPESLVRLFRADEAYAPFLD